MVCVKPLVGVFTSHSGIQKLQSWLLLGWGRPPPFLQQLLPGQNPCPAVVPMLHGRELTWSCWLPCRECHQPWTRALPVPPSSGWAQCKGSSQQHLWTPVPGEAPMSATGAELPSPSCQPCTALSMRCKQHRRKAKGPNQIRLPVPLYVTCLSPLPVASVLEKKSCSRKPKQKKLVVCMWGKGPRGWSKHQRCELLLPRQVLPRSSSH